MKNFKSKSSVKAERLAPKYARQNLWLIFWSLPFHICQRFYSGQNLQLS